LGLFLFSERLPVYPHPQRVAHHAGAAHPSIGEDARIAPSPTSCCSHPPTNISDRSRLSILGIRNTIHDLGARYDVNHDDRATKHISSAQLTELAIHEWERRYPHDGQVPKAIYLIQRLYTKVLTQESRDRAIYVEKWMFSDYAKWHQKDGRPNT
jgi:hypothetical protein